jgi:hypothetical protein
MSQASALRQLPLRAPHTAWSALAAPSDLCVWLAGLAVVLQLTVSSNVLLMLHIPYNTDGGNPLIKFHPSTYLAMLALALRLCGSGRPMRTFEQLTLLFPRVMIFLLMMILCMLWMIVNVGVSGVAVYVESYFSAGVLFLAIADASERQRRMLGWVMMWLFLFNAVVGTVETVLHRTLTPFYLGTKPYHMIDSEFRGLALYNHPLSGSMMTEMAVLLLAQMRLSPRLTLVIGGPLMLGLVSFGGRTALLVTMLTILLIGGVYMVRGVADRTIKPMVILGAILAVVVTAVLLWFIVTQTAIGERLAGKLSFNDNSAETRNFQWLILGQLNVNQMLFGITQDQEVAYIYQIGLVYPFHIIENFWLLGFIYLGGIGFLLYLFGFFSFLMDIWRFAPMFGRAIMVTTVLVASTSNSLGQKSNILFVMTAAVVASTGFARTQLARTRGGQRPEAPVLASRPVLQDGDGAMRALVRRAPPDAAAATAFAPPPDAPPSPGAGRGAGWGSARGGALGGLLRDPTPPDRALRPLRPTSPRL